MLAVRWRRLGLFYNAEVLSVQSDSLPTLAHQLRAGSVTLDVWAAVGRCLRRHHDAGINLAGLQASALRVGGSDGVQVGDYHRARVRTAGLWSAADMVRLRRSIEGVLDTAGQSMDEVAWHCLLAAYG